MIAALLSAACVLLLAHRYRPAAPRRPPAAVTRSGATDPDRDVVAAAPARRVRPWRRRSGHDPADIAAWCDRLARSVRGGATLSGAVRSTVGPTTAPDEFAQLSLALDRGTPLDRAVASAGVGGDLAVALMVIRACAVTGAPAAEPLDRAAAALRGRAAESAERRTQSEQARLSAIVMTILPGAMLAILVTTSSSVRQVLGSPVGVALVLVGATANLVGWRWMRRIVGSAAR